jgi:molybdopterin-containing oxidoreductase family iron-sulfur binding subunit
VSDARPHDRIDDRADDEETVDREPSRRDFLARSLLGLGASASALAACTRAPDKRIVPYAEQPPEATPGLATHYATALPLDGYVMGVIATCREGRPIKIEGNPAHPASLGATSAIEQAATLGLYDPARARGFRRGAEPSSFGAFERAVLDARPGSPLAGRVAFVMEPTSSATLAMLLPRVRARLPRASFHFVATGHDRRAAREGARRVLGAPLEIVPRLDRAEVIVSLDADLLGAGAHAVAFARAFAARRALRSARDPMSRAYVVEPTPTVTGIAADERLALRRADVAPLRRRAAAGDRARSPGG